MAKRRQHSPQLKAKVALEALKGIETAQQIAARFEIHPSQISTWKRQLLEGASDLFVRGQRPPDNAAREAELYEQIGRLKMENEWLKKKLNGSAKMKRALIEPGHPTLSIARQCELAGLSRSSYYYAPAGESAENLYLIRMIDEQYLKTPFYGSRRMTAWLQLQGYQVNRKRIRRLMRLMGLEAVGPKPSTSRPVPEHRIYPYLLKDVDITRTCQVWSTDITFVPMPRGYMYLTAVLDWFSRYVLAWEVSNTLDVGFCLSALDGALAQDLPEIFNTDQGAQFTSLAFTGRLEAAEVSISMDGRGCALDNAFVERLWRTVKYEDFYLKDYEDGHALRDGLHAYFTFYNHERPHQSLNYFTPAQVHYDLA